MTTGIDNSGSGPVDLETPDPETEGESEIRGDSNLPEIGAELGEAAAEIEPEGIFGYRLRDPVLLRVALTHRSYSNEQGEEANYERLEFLGDSVLGLVASHWLFRRFPGHSEGELAKLKSVLVSAKVLTDCAREHGLGEHLLLGVGEERSGGRGKASILADVMESVFGAIYLDGGLEAAREVIETLLERALEERSRLTASDTKTRLQELTQARGWSLPTYRLVGESGPDHRKVFTVECQVGTEMRSKAQGSSKKSAEQAAAAVLLHDLDPGEAAT